jgi:hypothetical protein
MSISETSKKVISVLLWQYIIVMALALPAVRYYQFDTPGAFIIGLTLGTGQSMFKVVLLERGIIRLLEMKRLTSVSALFYMLLRNVMSIGLLVAAVFFKQVSFIGVSLGLIMLQISAFMAKRKEA